MSDYHYEEVKWEVYPKGKALVLLEIIEEGSSEYVSEVRFRVNEQKDQAFIRIEERERCQKIYLDSLKRKL